MPEDIIYLNNAATTWPKPKSVLDAVQESFSLPYMEPGRASFEGITDHPAMARQLLADFFHTGEPEKFQFTSNVTDSLNTALCGYFMGCKEKVHAVTTALDHNAVLRPLYALADRGLLELSIVDFDERGYVSPQAIEDVLRDDTRLLAMNHGSNVLGTRQDIEAIGKALPEDVFFMVDAAQTAGHYAIDIKKTGADLFAFTGHKALFGLPGIGGFFIKDPERICCTRFGGTGVLSESRDHPQKMPYKFEAGTHNYPGIVSLAAGIEFIQGEGFDALGKKSMSLISSMISSLAECENIEVYNDRPDLPIVSLNIGGLSSDDVAMMLASECDAVTRGGLHCAPLVHERIDEGRGCLRMSPYIFNTPEDVDTVCAALADIAAGAG